MNHFCYYIFAGNVFTNLSEGNHAKQNETDGRHQYAIVWVLLGLCVIFLCIAFWYFSKKKWHKIVHFSPVPKSQGNYTARRLKQSNRTRS